MKAQKQARSQRMFFFLFWGCLIFMGASYLAAQSTTPTTLDDLFAEVGRRVPAFGGMFVDEGKNTLYVYMVPGQPGDLVTLNQAVIDVFGSNRPQQQNIQALPGQYTFVQLKEWYDEMSRVVLAISGTVFTDIDEAKNRLAVGLENANVVPGVQAALRTLGIPPQAVDIEVVPPVEPTQFARTLQSGARPMVGGIQISPGPCTLGVPVIGPGLAHGFVTAGHCSNVAGDGNSPFFQPVAGAAVSTLVRNPAYLPAGTPGAPAACPAGRSCRFSDSLFAQLDPGTGATLGAIAQPTFGGIAWNGVTNFTITAGLGLPLAGSTVQKVGRTSGWTQGTVVRTCITTNKTTPGLTLICQYTTTLLQQGGDSGAPAFGITNLGTGAVTLVGIMWGAYQPATARGEVGLFSPLAGIVQPGELGGLIICPTLPTCFVGP